MGIAAPGCPIYVTTEEEDAALKEVGQVGYCSSRVSYLTTEEEDATALRKVGQVGYWSSRVSYITTEEEDTAL